MKTDAPAFQGYETVDKKSSRRYWLIILFLVLLLLLAGLTYAGYQYFLMQQKHHSATPTPIPTQMPINTPTPMASSSATASLSGTLAPSQTGKTGKTTPTPSAGIKRSKTTISVLNGSGIPGAAGKIATYLQGLGYSIGTTGNATSFDYAGLTIEVKKTTDKTVLTQLQADLKKQYTVSSTSATLNSSNPADAIVIVGQ